MKKQRKTPSIGKTRQTSETRVYPKNGQNMTTLAYVAAYHASNASVHLTTVDYLCKETT